MRIIDFLKWLFSPYPQTTPKPESPIEEQFWAIGQSKIAGLTPQYQVGKYRLDFAVPSKMVAIELDGHDYHSSKQQRTADAKRERYLQENGWLVIRFTGSEIFVDAQSCVNQTIRIISRNRK